MSDLPEKRSAGNNSDQDKPKHSSLQERSTFRGNNDNINMDRLPKKTSPVPNAVKVRKPIAHPRYLDMVIRAIRELNERNGSSRHAIMKRISSNFKVEESASTNNHVKRALKKGLANGLLRQSKGVGLTGSFRVNSETHGRLMKPPTNNEEGPAPKKSVRTPKKSTDRPKKTRKRDGVKKKPKKSPQMKSKEKEDKARRSLPRKRSVSVVSAASSGSSSDPSPIKKVKSTEKKSRSKSSKSSKIKRK